MTYDLVFALWAPGFVVQEPRGRARRHGLSRLFFGNTGHKRPTRDDSLSVVTVPEMVTYQFADSTRLRINTRSFRKLSDHTHHHLRQGHTVIEIYPFQT